MKNKNGRDFCNFPNNPPQPSTPPPLELSYGFILSLFIIILILYYNIYYKYNKYNKY